MAERESLRLCARTARERIVSALQPSPSARKLQVCGGPSFHISEMAERERLELSWGGEAPPVFETGALPIRQPLPVFISPIAYRLP